MAKREAVQRCECRLKVGDVIEFKGEDEENNIEFRMKIKTIVDEPRQISIFLEPFEYCDDLTLKMEVETYRRDI